MDMTSEGWGRCFKVTLQTRAPENFRSCRWGDERTVKREQTVSEDPHRRDRNFSTPNYVDNVAYNRAMLNLLESALRDQH